MEYRDNAVTGRQNEDISTGDDSGTLPLNRFLNVLQVPGGEKETRVSVIRESKTVTN